MMRYGANVGAGRVPARNTTDDHVSPTAWAHSGRDAITHG